MIAYKNLNNDSGVIEYEIGNGIISVKFRDGKIYDYTNSITGANNVIQMIKLAQNGSGLNSFINSYVKKLYARKR